MFNNIGSKIKGLASFFTWIGIIASLVIGLNMLGHENTRGAGISIMILGSLLSWVMSFVLYGFGQLVENSDKLVSMNEQTTGKSGVNSSQSYHDRLAVLEKLKSDGLITEEEYLDKKSKL